MLAAVRATSRATRPSAWAMVCPSITSSPARSRNRLSPMISVYVERNAASLPRPSLLARRESALTDFSATSKAPRMRRTSDSLVGRRLMRSLGRCGGRRSAAMAPRARPATSGVPGKVTLRVPPPARRLPAVPLFSRRASISSAWRIPAAMSAPSTASSSTSCESKATVARCTTSAPERAGSPADGNGEEDGVAVLAQLGEMLVGCMLRGVHRGDGAEVLDRLAGHPVADREPHLAHDSPGKPDISAHDELVAVAFEEVERADLGAEDGGDPARRLVEQRHQRHRLGGEGHQLEDRVEAMVAACMHGAGANLAHRPITLAAWPSLTAGAFRWKSRRP